MHQWNRKLYRPSAVEMEGVTPENFLFSIYNIIRNLPINAIAYYTFINFTNLSGGGKYAAEILY